jgi:ABC-type transporter Mla maintaining outer membrane lipid asymmetry permease subunit MlaE
VRYGPRILAWSLVVGAVQGLLVGSMKAVEFSLSLHRFGGLEYVPRVWGLSAVRVWGPSGSMLASAATAIVTLHRAARRGASETESALPLFVGGATILLYPVVVVTGSLAALLVWIEGDDQSARTFVTLMTAGLDSLDVIYGLVATAVYALVVATGIRFGAGALFRWRLVPKLLVAWVALQGVHIAVGLLGRWFA